MLTAAYSWVGFSGSCTRLTDAKSAYARMNGMIAKTIVRAMKHPQSAVMVNIFMPCELMHAMGLQPMFPEGLAVYVACTACQHVFGEHAEEAGVPESFCSYQKTMIGMAESGVLPKPCYRPIRQSPATRISCPSAVCRNSTACRGFLSTCLPTRMTTPFPMSPISSVRWRQSWRS